MSFPVENRPIVLAGVANVTRANMTEAIPQLATAIVNIAGRHPDERILVHTVSYALAKVLKVRVEAEVGRRRCWTYSSARDRDFAVEQYRTHKGSIIFAPSLDRGVDFKDDDCRVQIVAKVPFPNLGDRRTAARMHLPGGQWWYQVQTVRTIMQMTGRGVRSAEDWAVTYIIDKQFSSNLYNGAGKRLFPKWWQDAIDRSFNPRSLTIAA
jgi:Rad3-related DNA helicase